MAKKLTGEESVSDLLSQMTAEEKALLVTGASAFTTYGIERLGIPSVNLLDGATGLNFSQLFGDVCQRLGDDPDKEFGGQVSPAVQLDIRDHLLSPEEMSEEGKRVYALIRKYLADRLPDDGGQPGCFPPGILLGATWDPDAVYLCGNAVGKEAAACKVDVLLGPNVNIHRDPRNGRLYEGYSEDPCLAASLAPLFVRGVQGTGVLACPKHFAANNQETFRHRINERISLRALYEIYFPGFRACVKEGAGTIMSAYNKINGKECAMNEWLLTGLLRGEWGFEGFVVSDWHAAYDQAEALRAGNDLDMPGERDVTPILEALENGTLPEAALDRAAAKVLTMILHSNTVRKAQQSNHFDRAYSAEAAYRAAAEGAVLLENNGVLPLAKGTPLRFFGKRTRKFNECGNGSTLVQTTESAVLPDECARYTDGIRFEGDAPCREKEVLIVTAAAGGQEGSDRSGLSFDPGEEEMMERALAAAKASGSPAVLLLNVAGPVDLRPYKDRFDAILCLFLPGMKGAQAAADILFGAVCPSGRLPITFPEKLEDVPAYLSFPGTPHDTEYGEGIYVGYRYYDARKIRPLYPFGYGLSYTTFELTDPALDSDTLDMDAGGSVTVSVTVRNTGTRDGKEVVQLYISDPVSFLPKPEKELKAFRKVFLAAGEEKRITFTVTKEMLCSYDEALREWTAEAGRYEVLIGTSSADLPVRLTFTASGSSPYGFGKNAPLIQYLMQPETDALLREYVRRCGWDESLLSDSMQYWPEQPLIDTLRNFYPYAEQEDLWEEFFRKAAAIPPAEFSFRDVAAWEAEHALLTD